jgi:hypothetical protein
MIAFLALLFVLLVIYAMTKTKEGFNPMNTSPEHRINIPVNEIPSMLAPASEATVGNTVSEPASNGSIFPGCDVKASSWPGMLPGPLPTAPYEQIAVGSPLPYQDTSLIKANRQQLINMLEMLKGFLAFEAQEISERSDPTIQLPLQTARTDFHVLQAQVEVLNRNPGIQPTITLSHLNEIGSNLAFLQSEVRLIGSAGPIQGPIYEFTKPVEGFFGGSPDAKKGGNQNGRNNQTNAMKTARARTATKANMDAKASTGLKGGANSSAQMDATSGKGKDTPMKRSAKKYESAYDKEKKAFGDAITPDDDEWEKEYWIERDELDEEARGGYARMKSQQYQKVVQKVLQRIDPKKLKDAEARVDTAKQSGVGLEEAFAYFGTLVESVATPDEFKIISENAMLRPEDEKVVNAQKSAKEAAASAKKEEAVASAKKAVAEEAAKAVLSDLTSGNDTTGQSEPASRSTESTAAPVDAPSSGSTQATLKDLKDFILRINCESVRLSESGSSKSDPITGARMEALASIRSTMESLVKMVEMDPTTEVDIPVTKAQLDKALPTLGKPGTPIPNAIKNMQLPPEFANLFPSIMQNDPKIAKKIRHMADTYLGDFMDGISFSVKYTSPREAQAGCSRSEQFVNAAAERKRTSSSTIDKTGFPSLDDLDNASNSKFTPMDSGLFITDRYAPMPSDAGRGPSHFDWKMRCKEVEAQVKKRGLRPDDFGIMPPKTAVSSDFSWKGYARMMCTRLQATMDPHLPVLCGCPPMDWPGWRIAK